MQSFLIRVCVCTALTRWLEAQLKVQQMAQGRPPAPSLAKSFISHLGISCSESRSARSNYFCYKLLVSRTPEYSLSWVRYWVSCTNVKSRINFPWFFSRNPAEETQVAQYQPSDCFLALLLESRTTLMMSKGSLKGGCQKWLIWGVCPGVNGLFKQLLKNTNESAKCWLAQEPKFWPSQLPPTAHIEVSTKELFVYAVADFCLG